MLQTTRKKVKFVLVSHGRSGSTLFFDLLSQNPDYDQLQKPQDAEVLSRRIRLPSLYLEYLAYRSQSRLFGVHIKVFDHLEKINRIYSLTDQIAFFRKLVNNNWKIIYLRRENILRIALSILIAGERKIWHVKSAEEKTNLKLVNIDKRMLLRCMQITELRLQRDLNAISHVEYFPMVYESDLINPEFHQKTMDTVFNYLDISNNISVKASFLKTSGDNLAETISNLDEIVKFISSIPKYKIYLDELY
jgi:hypothetical protein